MRPWTGSWAPPCAARVALRLMPPEVASSASCRSRRCAAPVAYEGGRCQEGDRRQEADRVRDKSTAAFLRGSFGIGVHVGLCRMRCSLGAIDEVTSGASGITRPHQRGMRPCMRAGDQPRPAAAPCCVKRHRVVRERQWALAHGRLPTRFCQDTKPLSCASSKLWSSFHTFVKHAMHRAHDDNAEAQPTVRDQEAAAAQHTFLTTGHRERISAHSTTPSCERSHLA